MELSVTPATVTPEPGSEPAPASTKVTGKELRTSLDLLTSNLHRAGLAPEEESKAIATLVQIAGKCEYDDLIIWRPFGGATSFAEIDAYEDAAETADEVHKLYYAFDSICANLWADCELDVRAKATAIAAAARDFEGRVSTLGGKDAKKLTTRIMEKLFGAQHQAPAGTIVPVRGITEEQIKTAVADATKATVRRTEHVETEWLDVDFDAEDAEKAASAPGTLTITKQADGRYRYAAVATNDRWDKEQERFSPEAHKDYVTYADASKDYPELWLWHTPDTRMGVADCIYFDEATGHRVSTGLFDKGMEDVAERLEKMGTLAMSHGFIFRKDDLRGGVYHRYRSFEETVLPSREYAANEGTTFFAAREEPMAADTKKREFFEQVLGKERFASLELSLGARAGGMSEAEFSTALKEALATEEPKPAATTAAPAAPTEPAPTASAPAATAEEPAGGEGGEVIKALQKSLPGIVSAGIKDVIEPLRVGIEEIGTWRKTVDEAIVALRATDDQKIAAALAARGAKVAPTAGPADSEDTKANEEDQEALRALAKSLGVKFDADGKMQAPGNVVEDAPAHLAPVLGLLGPAFRGS